MCSILFVAPLLARYYRMLGVKPRGLERFENRFGEPLPSPLPKAAALAPWRWLPRRELRSGELPSNELQIEK